MAEHDRPSINTNSSTARFSALVHTRDLDDFNIPDGQPDPRGWSVKTADGTSLGTVEDLLFDTEQQRVRYIEVKADNDIAKHGGRDFFLLPIGTARLDDTSDDVIVSMDATAFTGGPAYDRDRMSRDYETSLRDYVRERADSTRTPRETFNSTSTERDVGFYSSPEYDDESFFSRGRSRRDRSPGDRIADTADDIKDRFDGNPASRPGPDVTDRRM